MSLAHHIERQPSDQEIVHVIAAEQTDAGSPSRTQPEKLRKTRGARGVQMNWVSLYRHPLYPRDEPKQAGRSKHDEEWAPAESGHQHPAYQHAKPGAQH